jgi:hypothetical protein
MKNILSVFLLCMSIVYPTYSFSLVQECSSLHEVLDEARPGTLIIFDIDNTLLRPSQMLGSDEWFRYYLQKREAEMQDREEAFNEAVELLHGVYSATKVQPIDPCTSEVVRLLQDQGSMVMALTSRDPAVANLTIRHLSSLGMNMQTTAPSSETFTLIDAPHALFSKGILFTRGKSKKNALTCFFKQLGWKPQRIVFIDDRRTYLEEMKSYEEEGIEFVGLRFNGADAYVNSLDQKICDIQLDAFCTIISDVKAAELLEGRSEAVKIH